MCIRDSSPDGRLAASIAAGNVQTQIWNPRTGMVLTNLPTYQVQEVAFSPDGRWLACCAVDATTFWWTEDWSLRRHIPIALEGATHYRVAFSPDGRIAAFSASDHEIRLVVVQTGEELATLPSSRLLTCLAFSPDGDQLATVSEPGYFQLWNLRKLREELAAINLDWPDIPLPPDRNATGKLHITVSLGASEPFNLP